MKSTHGSVSRQTLYLAILSALIAGFVGGVGYSAYRSAALSAPQQQAGGHTHSNEAATAEAVAALEKKALEDPDNAQVWADLGHAFFDSGQADSVFSSTPLSTRCWRSKMVAPPCTKAISTIISNGGNVWKSRPPRERQPRRGLRLP